MSDKPSPDTHVSVGVFRPLLADVMADMEIRYPIGYPDGCCYRPWNGGGTAMLTNDWVRGMFDKPVYRTVEEVIKLRGSTEPPFGA